MIKNIFFALVILGSQNLSVTAQVLEKKTLKAGQNWFEFAYYLFPSFAEGTAKLKSGGQSTYKMNFNMLLCQMQFINEHRDTLNIDPSEIDSIIVNSKTFFYKKGYFEVISDFDSVKLLVLRTVKYEPVKTGAMGQPSHGNSIDNYATLRDENESKQLILNVDLDIYLESTYFFEKKKADMVRATKSNFLSSFKKNKPDVEDFIKSNKLNFNNESDLKKLLSFCVR